MQYSNNSNNAKMDRREHIEHIIEKFLDGKTSNSEERELYDWFANNDVPAEWSELKDMFAWYDAGMPENSDTEEQLPTPVATHTPRHNMTLRFGGWSAAIAAAAVVVVGIVLWPETESASTTINIYEGSYVVENGVINDDITYIQRNIEEVLARADEMEHKANELLAWADI